MRALITAITATVALAAPAAAQQPTHPHRGFWWGFGLGAGSNVTDGFGTTGSGGLGGYLRLGGSPSQKVQLGFETITWVASFGDRTWTRGNGTFSVMVFPTGQGFFVKSGLGFASISAERIQGNTRTETTEEGFGFTAGLGYDIRIGRNMYLTPNLDLLLQALGEKTDPILGDIPETNTIILFTLGLTWH